MLDYQLKNLKLIDVKPIESLLPLKNNNKLLIASDLWFDEIKHNGKVIDTYEAMAEYEHAFNDMTQRISTYYNAEPITITEEDEGYDYYTELGIGSADEIKYWKDQQLALVYSHEDKEIPILIWLIKGNYEN